MSLLRPLKDAFHVLMGAYAILLMSAAVFNTPLMAQRQAPSYQAAPEIQNLEERVRVIEDLKIDHRLTVIETLLRDLDSSSTWFRVSTGGTGALLAKAVYDQMTRKENGRKGENPGE